MKILLIICFIGFLLFTGSMIYALLCIAGEADEANEREYERWKERHDGPDN